MPRASTEWGDARWRAHTRCLKRRGRVALRVSSRDERLRAVCDIDANEDSRTPTRHAASRLQ
jgi:hypothetical protein